MKQSNREKMLRAIGVMDGLSFVATDAIGTALEMVIGVMQEILENEEDGDGRKTDGDRFDF